MSSVDTPPDPALAPAPPRARRPLAPIAVAVLAPLLVVVSFLGGVALDRAGLLPGSPAAPPPAVTPGPTTAPGPSGTPGPEPTGGASARPTLPPGVSGLDLITEAWELLHRNYVLSDALDDRAMAYAAIRAMTEAVGDTGHTQFLTPEELAALEQSLSGEFVGIGVEIDTSDEVFRIADVIPGTPAEEAGLRRGDVITAVNGTEIADLSQEEAFSRVRGHEGEPVVLTIERAGRSPFDVRLVRRRFDLPLVSWTMVPGRDVAVVRLESFASGAADALRAALDEARAAGATGLVFDLRGNPGGFVTEAVSVASQFLPGGTVYVTRDRDGRDTPSRVERGGRWTDRPLVVLVDGNTASSAEIVSSAIQDAGRGTIVGVRTFGTGTVLGRFDLVDGSSLRIGTVLWLTRDGRPLWQEGLLPDVVVELDLEAPRLRPRDIALLAPGAVDSAGDTQLVRALLELAGS